MIPEWAEEGIHTGRCELIQGGWNLHNNLQWNRNFGRSAEVE